MKYLLKTSLLSLVFVLSACSDDSEEEILNYPVLESDSNTPFDLSRGEYACYEMVTSLGNIELALDEKYAPATTLNFNNYVDDSFYDGLIFHRVIPDFMIQGGGFEPELIPKATQDAIEIESKNGLKNYRGRIAMARTSVPDSATSQFFINTVDNAFLDYGNASDGYGYTVFGEVIAGMDVVDAIEAVETSEDEYVNGYQNVPVDDVTIDTITPLDCPID
jgi:cyclophilin family peptidyl-prolyl cis-trans isomerase